jgi:hypothetical protein
VTLVKVPRGANLQRFARTIAALSCGVRLALAEIMILRTCLILFAVLCLPKGAHAKGNPLREARKLAKWATTYTGIKVPIEKGQHTVGWGSDGRIYVHTKNAGGSATTRTFWNLNGRVILSRSMTDHPSGLRRMQEAEGDKLEAPRFSHPDSK